MPRKPLRPEPSAQAQPEAPVIHDSQVFTVPALKATLGFPKGTFPREIRLGRLKAAKRGGRYLVLGLWVKQWIEDGQVRPKRRREAPRMPQGE